MTTAHVTDVQPAGEGPRPRPLAGRGSPLPTPAMVRTRFMELRRRRGLMIALSVIVVGIPAIYLAVRLILHLAAPSTYGPAGGYDSYTALTTAVLYTFGFLAAAALGCTAGSIDLTEGMFRHLVITGRSRVALYLARIPAGLAIITSLVAVGYAVVCVVCVAAAPARLSYGGVSVPTGLSQRAYTSFAVRHADTMLCNLPTAGPVGCLTEAGRPPRIVVAGPDRKPIPATAAQTRSAVLAVARHTYGDYRQQVLAPDVPLMIRTGLWIELEAAVGFLVGLGLASLLGQRTVALVVMIVLEVVLTPIAIRTRIPHFLDLQRGIVGVATAQLEPSSLPLAFGGGGGDFRVHEPVPVAVCVILGWVLVWTGLGVWRMTTRDA